VREPKVFLFDEPLSNLDAELRVQMRVEIAALHERLGNTMIYVTHDQVEAMTMADKIVILRLGKVEQVGRPLDLYNAPANRFVAGFIGSPRMNFLEGHISTIGNGVTVAIEGAPEIRVACRGDGCRPGDPVTLGIRPEHIRRADGHGLHASVKADEQLGSDSYLYCTLPGGQALTIHAPGQTPERRGDGIAITYPPELCHLFHQQGDDEPALPALRNI
jgi:ABC-type sugar transport system ATPase subunit